MLSADSSIMKHLYFVFAGRIWTSRPKTVQYIQTALYRNKGQTVSILIRRRVLLRPVLSTLFT